MNGKNILYQKREFNIHHLREYFINIHRGVSKMKIPLENKLLKNKNIDSRDTNCRQYLINIECSEMDLLHFGSIVI